MYKYIYKYMKKYQNSINKYTFNDLKAKKYKYLYF